jgi:hypothetical protein
MPQIFEGDWRSVLIGRGGVANDTPFHLEVDPATNHLKPSSTHQGQITGDVTNFTISITETFPQIPTVTLTYVGNLCGEVPVGTQRHLMICGVMTLIGIGPQDEEIIEAAREISVLRGILERNRLNGQIQEIWIATKP